MNGWEIASMLVGMFLVLEAESTGNKLVGAIMVLLPLYFNMWRG